MTRFSRDIQDLLDMTVHIADENAREVRLARLVRFHGRGLSETSVVSQALLEHQEWEAFKAKLERRSRLISGKVPVGVFVSGAAGLDGEPADFGTEDVDEDDVDMLLVVVDALERSHPHPLTLTEVTRALQSNKVLSREFIAQARQQTQRLLDKLRALNRAWQDPQGRWGLQ